VLLRAIRDAKILTGRALVDSVAAEYLNVDTNPEAYSKRLMLVVLPFVLERLEIGRDDRLIEGAISTAVIEWETKRTMSTTTVTTLARQSPGEVIEDLRQQKGWSIEELGAQAGLNPKQIYRVKRCKPVKTTTIARLAGPLDVQPAISYLLPLPSRANTDSLNRRFLPSNANDGYPDRLVTPTWFSRSIELITTTTTTPEIKPMKADTMAPKDMARRNRWTVKYVYDLLAAGRIPGAKKIGSQWATPVAAVEQLDRPRHRPMSRC
jgi:transcriptional regulator with XRE-family HTH domain